MRPRAFPRVLGDLARDHLEARLHRELRNARAHRPEPDDSDLHGQEPNDGLEAELVQHALERCLDSIRVSARPPRHAHRTRR